VLVVLLVAFFVAYQSTTVRNFFASTFGGNSGVATNIPSTPKLSNINGKVAFVALTRLSNPRQELDKAAALKIFQTNELFFDHKLVEWLPEESKEQLIVALGLPEGTDLPTTQLDSLVTDNPGFSERVIIAVLPDLDFRYKTLKIAGKLPLKDSATYPWQFDVALVNLSETATQRIFNIMQTAYNLPQTPTNLEALQIDDSKINKIFAGGEIIPARAVDRLSLNMNNNYTVLFDRFAEDIKSADLAIALLENPVSADPKPCTGCTTFVGDERVAKGLADVGFDLLGAGNHAGDGGLTAMKRTQEVMKEVGIGFTGASASNLQDAAHVEIRDFGGKKLGFMSYDDVAYFYWAGANKWGANRFSKVGSSGLDPDLERIKTVVQAAKAQVDYLIIYGSAGVEYTDTANPGQVKIARALIDNGADMLLGTHPHWVQNFEVYKGKPIFYSLGNFIFDQTHTDPTRQGLLVNAFFYDHKLVSFELMPTLTCGYHQTKDSSSAPKKNLVGKILDGSMTYAQVDATPENQGCVYWQPKELNYGDKYYSDVWSRFTKSTTVSEK